MATDIANLKMRVTTDTSALSDLKSELGTIGKLAVDGAKAAASALTDFVSSSVEGYGELEQFRGGVEKLFGDSADIIQKNADNAFATMGMTASQYLEQSTQIAASMIKSLGGDQEKAAQQVDKAMKQMSDNVSVFGTDLEMVKTAYNGFARQSFIALDNLKLGYSGSKEGMEALLADAKEFSGIDYNIESYSDIVDAIDVIQEHQGIMGNAAKEASKTIEGSLNAMKASWQNLVTGFADPEADIDKLVDNVIESATNALDNLYPAILRALESVTTALPGFIQAIMQKVPELVNTLGPPLVETIKTLIGTVFNMVVDGLPSLIGTLVSGINSLISGLPSKITGVASVAVELITTLVDSIATAIPSLISGGTEILVGAIETVLEVFSSPDIWEAGANLLQGIVDGLLESVSILTDSAPDIIDSFLEACSNAIEVLVTVGPEIVEKLVQGIVQAIPNILSGVVELITGFTDFLKNNAGGVTEAGGSIIASLVTGIIEAVPALLEAIPQIIVALFDLLMTLISTAWEGLKTLWTSLWGSLGDNIGPVFSQIVANVGTWLSQLPEKISYWIGYAIGWIAKKVPEAITAAKNLGKSVVDGTVEFVKTLPEKVAKFIEEIPGKIRSFINQFKEAGKSLINSVWEGMKSAWNNVVNWVNGVIQNIQGMFNSFLSGITAGYNAVPRRVGISYVPTDGYIASLHEGEAVLTKQEAQRYRDEQSSGGSTVVNNYNITVPQNPNALETALKLRDLTRKDDLGLVKEV